MSFKNYFSSVYLYFSKHNSRLCFLLTDYDSLVSQGLSQPVSFMFSATSFITPPVASLPPTAPS